jgi:hypothetical protein
MSVLNIAGPEYDFGSVVFVVLGECEHRRRGFERDELEFQLMQTAKAKLAKIKKAYDEFGGSAAYWKTLETEVLETAMPQYIAAAEKMNMLERDSFGVWRDGDPVARLVFGLGGLTIGSIVVAIPFIKIFEVMFAFALGAAGLLYPEIKRYTHERRHMKFLNRLVAEAAAYQQNARLHYMTTTDIRESFHIAAYDEPEQTTETDKREVAE